MFYRGRVDKDLDENTQLDLDRNGNIRAITIEHAQDRTDILHFTYEQVGGLIGHPLFRLQCAGMSAAPGAPVAVKPSADQSIARITLLAKDDYLPAALGFVRELRLQYLNDVDPDLEPKIASDFGRELFQYVVAARPD